MRHTQTLANAAVGEKTLLLQTSIKDKEQNTFLEPADLHQNHQ